MKKRIVFTGGGTAGHFTPNIALFPFLEKEGYESFYIGSYNGIEKRLIEDFHVPYYGISTGKLRRYFDLKNLSDPFRVIKGYTQALKIPCIIHESDMTPGLANKLCIPVATKVCCNFPETTKYVPSGKAVLTGSPIRTELTTGSKLAALELCGFTANKPVVMVIGGSQGASSVNVMVREALPKLLEDFQVVHICGKDKVDNLMLTIPGYKQFEYLKSDLKDVFAMADVVVSRAGANAICELLALKKPNLLIPLQVGSRGDQILNAKSFEEQGFSMVVREDFTDCDILTEKIYELYENRQMYIDKMSESGQMNSIDTIINLIKECSK